MLSFGLLAFGAVASRRALSNHPNHTLDLADPCGCVKDDPEHPFVIDCEDGAKIREAYQTLKGCEVDGEASTDACEHEVGGVLDCQQAFYVIQVHHDHCQHDTLTRVEEEYFHVWEPYCELCAIERKYDSNLESCPVLNCEDMSVLDAAWYIINGTCTAADFETSYEWGGSFDTPDDSYTWVSQAQNVSGEPEWTDPAMKMVFYPMTSSASIDLDAIAGPFNTVDAVFDTPCTTIVSGATVTPSATTCYLFDFDGLGFTDFRVTIDTSGVGYLGIFAEHGPTEFERDTHYFLDTDDADVEPIAVVPIVQTTEYEWGGSFDTPANSYKWVSQPVGASMPYEFADPTMTMAFFGMTSSAEASLEALAGAGGTADNLLRQDPCITIVSGNTVVPSADDCYKFDFTGLGNANFEVTIDTSSVDYLGIFAQHVPTEFERDTHYLLTIPSGADVEPVAEVGAAGGHDHGRRLQTTVGRHSRRKLSAEGSCCNTPYQIGAFRSLVAYHDLCDHDDLPFDIEVEFHNYEDSCADHFCNAVGEDYDGTICPSPPPPPAPPSAPDANPACGDPAGDFDNDGQFRLADASFVAEVWSGVKFWNNYN